LRTAKAAPAPTSALTARLATLPRCLPDICLSFPAAVRRRVTCHYPAAWSLPADRDHVMASARD
jgi:hypothetical protein